MWVFTKQGFFSVVEDWDDKTMVWVRSRTRADIEAMQDLIKARSGLIAKIHETPDRDYLFRIHVLKHIWAQAIQDAANAIDYHNFKGSLHGESPARDRLMMDIWARLVQYQHEVAGRIDSNRTRPVEKRADDRQGADVRIRLAKRATAAGRPFGRIQKAKKGAL